MWMNTVRIRPMRTTWPLSELPKASKMVRAAGPGLGGLCSVLAKSGGGTGAKTGYTMRRLQVREGTACLLWVVYDFMMLLLFWALAALVIFGVMTLRMKKHAGAPIASAPRA